MQLPSALRHLACLVLLTGLPSAYAATYCVATVSELRDALTAAAASQADDEIRVRIGAYGVTQQLLYNSPNNGWLFVLGGYYTVDGNPCGGRSLSAFSTVLDGQGNNQVLGIYFNPPGATTNGPRLGVDNLTLMNGMGTGFQRGGGLDIASYGNAYAEIFLDNLAVRNNSGYFSGGINATVNNGLIRVANSWFEGNAAPTSAYGHIYLGANASQASVGLIFANNTVVNGTCPGNGSRGCGVGIGACAGVNVQISNNIFSNNQISDLNLEGCSVIGMGDGTVAMNANSGGSLSGNLTPTISNPLSLNPGFVNAAGFDFRLRNDSALINRGTGPIPLYGYNGFDLDGGLRVRNGTLDAGAFENQDWMMASGFE
jgi:hypothetical protein